MTLSAAASISASVTHCHDDRLQMRAEIALAGWARRVVGRGATAFWPTHANFNAVASPVPL